MSNLHKEQIAKSISSYLMLKAISLNELAVQCEVSRARLKDIQNNKWELITDSMWRKIYNVISPNNVEGLHTTRDFAAVMNLCSEAVKNRLMIGLIGDTGMGKTTALKSYAVNANVYYSYIDNTVTPGAFLSDLLQKAGRFWRGMNQNQLLKETVNHLVTVEAPLVIVDESAKLSDKMILCLHTLRDQTMSNCGIVLAGMPDFKNKLIKGKSANKLGYAEFFRRINLWHELVGLSSYEVQVIIEQNGITDEAERRHLKKHTRFGDLMNDIMLCKTVNYDL